MTQRHSKLLLSVSGSRRKKVAPIALFVTLLPLSGCNTLTQVVDEVSKNPQLLGLAPNEQDISAGLKAALNQGIETAVGQLSQDNGFMSDPVAKITFPAEANFALETLKKYRLGGVVTELERLLNRGAEEGVKKALPIFTNAITQMSISDARNILLGAPNAATDFFRRTSEQQLLQTFRPDIDNALQQVDAPRLWNKITTTYNAIPFQNKDIDTNLVDYTTQQAVNGLFEKMATEEAKIRDNPQARGTAILKRVFGYADSQSKSVTGGGY